MKKPDDIKRGLRHCSEDGCKRCPYEDECHISDGGSELAADALDYIRQLEKEKLGLFFLFSGEWHGKRYCFQQDDGTVYSRESCKYLTVDQAAEEFAQTLSALQNAVRELKWLTPKSCPPDVNEFFAVTKYDPNIRLYRKNLVDPEYTAEWINIKNDIIYWMPIPELPKGE